MPNDFASYDMVIQMEVAEGRNIMSESIKISQNKSFFILFFF
jgi:hypothetical protein